MEQDILLLIGRILVAVLLLYNGVNHFINTEMVTGYAEYKGVPQPQISVYVSGLLLLASGLSILLGVYPVVGGVLAALLTLVFAVMIHDFWTVEGDDRVNEMNHFLKNIGIAGGALVVASAGFDVWEYSLEMGLFL